jgi:PAS domain S-box-containing protein
LLRVALVGDSDDRSWSSALAERVEFIRVTDLASLETVQADLVLAVASPDGAASLIAALPKAAGAPPVTLLIGPDPRRHPQAVFVDLLIQAKRDWMTTFDAIVDPVALLDADGAVVRANVGFAGVVGRKVQDVISMTYTSLLGPPDAGETDPIAQTLADGQPRTGETRYQALAGIQQVTTSPMPGETRRVVVLLKDVTQLREQQERLLQASRLADIGLLAAGVAHEISTPLASISLRAESLLRSAEDERLQAIDAFKNFPRYLKTMDEEIFRCKKIISALLEFSRARKPEVKEVDLNALAEKAADLVSHQMKLRQVKLGLRLDPKTPLIEADEGQLRQALIALLMNSLDATPPQGHVNIETRREDEHRVSLSVVDDGSGIPEENLDKMFSPFFTTKPLGQGTGLGLAICHGIVTAHGGEIRVDSKVGQGTRISLLLPIRGKAASATR